MARGAVDGGGFVAEEMRAVAAVERFGVGVAQDEEPMCAGGAGDGFGVLKEGTAEATAHRGRVDPKVLEMGIGVLDTEGGPTGDAFVEKCDEGGEPVDEFGRGSEAGGPGVEPGFRIAPGAFGGKGDRRERRGVVSDGATEANFSGRAK